MSERLQRLKELLSRLQKPRNKMFLKILKIADGSMYEIKADTIEPITEDELEEFKGMKIFVPFPTVQEYLEFTNSRLNLN